MSFGCGPESHVDFGGGAKIFMQVLDFYEVENHNMPHAYDKSNLGPVISSFKRVRCYNFNIH